MPHWSNGNCGLSSAPEAAPFYFMAVCSAPTECSKTLLMCTTTICICSPNTGPLGCYYFFFFWARIYATAGKIFGGWDQEERLFPPGCSATVWRSISARFRQWRLTLYIPLLILICTFPPTPCCLPSYLGYWQTLESSAKKSWQQFGCRPDGGVCFCPVLVSFSPFNLVGCCPANTLQSVRVLHSETIILKPR